MSPSSDDDLARLIAAARESDRAAQEELWRRFFQPLINFARTRWQGRPPRGADPEDVALSAFNSVLCGIREGRFPRLDEPGNLWPLLVEITVHKAANLRRSE